ncbi:MAG: HD domain-containing protein [Thermodesulfobacteria bacterium]|nr:HD domain-containing protein [Thermodesulfobacteriota bacterium]
MRRLAKFLFEGAMLKRLERTGYAYLGTGSETIAAHSFGVALTALLLSSLVPEADEKKLLKMAILHDFLEARTGDLNSVNKLYDQVDEEAAAKDAFSGLPAGKEWQALWDEYRRGESLEAQLVHDADQLDLLIMLKEQHDLGNPYASRWITYAKRRLRTEIGQKLAAAITETDWASWWLDQFVAREDEQDGS